MQRTDDLGSPVSGDVVGFTRRIWLIGVIAGLLFAWPLLIHGRPTYLQDSISYYKGGRAAVDFALGKLTHRRKSVAPAGEQRPAPAHAAPAKPRPAAAAEQPRGVRSIIYSILVYLLGAPHAQLLVLAVAQALLTGLVVAVTMDAFAMRRVAHNAGAAALLAFTTPVAFVSVFAIPDIFTGLMAVAIIMLACAGQRLSPGVKMLYAGAGVLAVTAHASNPPIAAGLTLLALLWLTWQARQGHVARWLWLWVVAPLALGLLATLAVNRVGLGETSITAKRFPLTLARSISDGPARWYLEKHCPERRYAICEIYPGRLPTSVAEFLWGRNGIDARATPAQLDRIRAEEGSIVLAAGREYARQEIARLTANFVRQLGSFEPSTGFRFRVVQGAGGTPSLVPADSPPVIGLRWIGLLSTASALIAGIWIILRFRAFLPEERVAILLAVAALLGNAAICVFFSGIAFRYQARVIWIVPLLALGLYQRHQRRADMAAPEA